MYRDDGSKKGWLRFQNCQVAELSPSPSPPRGWKWGKTIFSRNVCAMSSSQTIILGFTKWGKPSPPVNIY